MGNPWRINDPLGTDTPLPLPDQREHFEKLFRDGFSWYGLRSVDLNKKCGCVGPDNRVQPGCKRCLQMGYVFTDFLIKGYFWVESPGFEYQAMPTPIATSTANFMGFHQYPIKKWDLLLELDLDNETGEPVQPFKINRTYVISSSAPIRGKNSRVEFYRCFLEERTLSDYRPGPR